MSRTLYGGLDPSYTGCACVLVDEDGKLVLSSTFAAPKKDFEHEAERLIHLRDEVAGFFGAHRPQVIAIEGYAHGRKFGREQAGELCGQLKVALYECDHKLMVVAPTALKKYVTGSGKGEKNLMLRAVYKKWGFEAADDNENDAFALAQVALEWLEGRPDLRHPTKAVKDVLKKLELWGG